MHAADRRLHGTIKKRPIDVFTAEEAATLAPLPVRPMPARTRRLKRKVSNDCFVNIDTIRYSVPHNLVGVSLMVEVGDSEVRIFDVACCVAVHARCQEAHKCVVISGHFAGLLRTIQTDKDATNTAGSLPSPHGDGAAELAQMGRTLAAYGDVVEGASL